MGFGHIAAQGSAMRRVIRAERAPVSSGLTPEQALDNLRSGLDYFFGETCPAEIAAQVAADLHHIHALRDTIAARIEAEFAVLDALTPDVDLEDGADFEDVTLPMWGGAA